MNSIDFNEVFNMSFDLIKVYWVEFRWSMSFDPVQFDIIKLKNLLAGVCTSNWMNSIPSNYVTLPIHFNLTASSLIELGNLMQYFNGSILHLMIHPDPEDVDIKWINTMPLIYI